MEDEACVMFNDSEREAESIESASIESASRNNTGPEYEHEFPPAFLTAMATLAELCEISDETAVAIMISYQRGNRLLRELHERYIITGDFYEFVGTLKVIASTKGQFDTPGKPVGTPFSDLDVANEEVQGLPIHGINELKENFEPLDMAMLKLAVVEKDWISCSTHAKYNETKDLRGLKALH
mmetsp:Transcript_323/g.666  ORF Transcript_323/g.666 Transcript_323/m.666 type:complete len:182 (-) Transcript_323:288-833(-)